MVFQSLSACSFFVSFVVHHTVRIIASLSREKTIRETTDIAPTQKSLRPCWRSIPDQNITNPFDLITGSHTTCDREPLNLLKAWRRLCSDVSRTIYSINNNKQQQKQFNIPQKDTLQKKAPFPFSHQRRCTEILPSSTILLYD